mmetsp:Transcript_51180/g.135936  ORF Transcript_51180/g.135936 Transcript_51180/m.135936 type:complete len:168 (-) Transcript_51180:104-607(-)
MGPVGMQVLLAALVFGAAAWPGDDGFLYVSGGPGELETTYKILRAGSPGAAAVEEGDSVSVHALGKLRSGKRFWSTLDDGPDALTYTVGRNREGSLITGWEYGARGMLKGEVRLLHIPSGEAFGRTGFPAWGIPADSDIMLEIEVVSIKEGDAGIADGEKLGPSATD